MAGETTTLAGENGAGGNAAPQTGRVARLQRHMAAEGVDAVVLLKPRNMFYFSGFNAVMYSRPQFVVIPATGGPTLIIPRLRERRAREVTAIPDIASYHEADPDPVRRRADSLLTKRLEEILPAGASVLGIEREAMSIAVHDLLAKRLPLARFVDVSRTMSETRAVKDQFELAEQEKAAAIARIGMEAAQRALSDGGTEIDANIEAEAAMAAAWRSHYPGDAIVGFGDAEDGVMNALWCWTRAGERASVAPPASTAMPIGAGTPVLVAIWTTINGYGIEYERTFFNGPPSPEHAGAFDAMMTVREAVKDALRPGTTPDAIATLTARITMEAGYSSGLGLIGHGIGLGHHEGPHLRAGDAGPLAAGTVVTVEPAIALPDCLIKHSDTLVVTEQGGRSITPWDEFADGRLLGSRGSW